MAPRAPRSFKTAQQDSLYGPSAMPFRRLNLFPLVDRGFRGTGVRIALLDTGFETGRPDFAAAHRDALPDALADVYFCRRGAARACSSQHLGSHRGQDRRGNRKLRAGRAFGRSEMAYCIRGDV